MVYHGLVGVFVFFLFAWAISESRTHVNFKALFGGLFFQVLIALAVLKLPFIKVPFQVLGDGVAAIKNATLSGASFVYGFLGGGEAPFAVKEGSSMFIFAFQAMPMILVFAALSMLLFHWRILPIIVRCFSFVLSRVMGIGGALGVSASAKVFLGPTEAPLLIRPYLKDFTRSELFTIMTCGMATTSGTVMALYATILEKTIPNAIGHILTASIISIPAAITLARVMIPDRGQKTSGNLVMPYRFNNWMDAIFRGASDGTQMIVSIIAMLIVVIALVTLSNSILGTLPHWGGEAITLERLFGYVMAPITWLMGVPWENAQTAGMLLAKKTVLNEIIGFLSFAKIPEGVFSAQTNLIMTYALCGFANFSCVGILIAGFGVLVPERRDEVVELSFKAMMAGTLATCLSGTIIGLLSALPF